MQKITNIIKKTDRIALALLVCSVIITVLMGVTHPKFLGKSNLQGMLIQIPEYGILAFGMMIAMIAGGIDLSLVRCKFVGIVAAVVMLNLGGNDFFHCYGNSGCFICWLRLRFV